MKKEGASFTPGRCCSGRKKRDLFNLRHGLDQLQIDPAPVVTGCEYHLAEQDLAISRANAEERMLRKLNRNLVERIHPLLPPGITFDEGTALQAFERVWRDLIARRRGEPWKPTE